MPLLIEDINSEYMETLNNKEYMKFSRHLNTSNDLSSQKRYIASFNDFSRFLLAIKDVNTNTLVGTSTLFVDYRKRNVNVGFLIFLSKAGNNYATLALELLMEFFNTNFPCFTVIIGTRSSNISMKKVAVKNNFNLDLQFAESDTEIVYYKRIIPPINKTHTPVLPEFIHGAKLIGVAANDAGGAQQVYSLMEKLNKPFVALLNGPAIDIFDKGNVEFKALNIDSDLIKCDLIITGSGWMSDLEFNALKICEESNIPSLTILDHWVNYKARFNRNFEINPNMLAVTNTNALELAKKDFPNTPILLIPDYQLEGYRTEINREFTPSKILILLEPNSSISDEFNIDLDMESEIIRKAVLINQKNFYGGVVIRPHPSTQSYNLHVKNLIETNTCVSISSNSNLVDDLKFTKIVLGFSSYGLYLSSMCGIETYSYFANMTGHWTNSFPKILSLSSKNLS